MVYGVIVLGTSIAILLVYWLYRRFDKDYQAQKLLDKYQKGNLTGLEIGTFYERYIGHLYEIDGYSVEYHGAVNGVSDLGRDLIARHEDEIQVVQTKCWASYKTVNENHIFQLYGTTVHYAKTAGVEDKDITAVFYTTAKYSKTAREVADVLGVELRSQELDRSYPLIKCNVNSKGEKIYHLPFDPYYDKVKILEENGEFFVHTVKEAKAKGFRRAKPPKKAA